jgi:3-methyladenine DNA glycosylase AlkD
MGTSEVNLNIPGIYDCEEVLALLESAFESASGDQEYLAGMQRTVPGVGKLYGVRVPNLREMGKQISQAYRKDPAVIREIALASWNQGSREHQLVALFLLAKLKLDPQMCWELGERFLPDVNNWETCDQLCHALFGEALAKVPDYMEVIETWLDNPNFWVRRAALVTPVLLRRAKYSPHIALDLDKRTLAMSLRLLDDPEKYIRKAVDWTVREVIKRNYELGHDWMMNMAQQNPSKIARSTLKLASKKLSSKDQEQFISLLEG